MRHDYIYGVTFHSDFRRFNRMIDLYCELIPPKANVLVSPGMSGAVLAGAIMAKMGERQPNRKIRHVHLPRVTGHHRHKSGYVGYFFDKEERTDNVICLVDDVIHEGITMKRCWRRLCNISKKINVRLNIDLALVWDVNQPEILEGLIMDSRCGSVVVVKTRKMFALVDRHHRERMPPLFSRRPDNAVMGAWDISVRSKDDVPAHVGLISANAENASLDAPSTASIGASSPV